MKLYTRNGKYYVQLMVGTQRIRQALGVTTEAEAERAAEVLKARLEADAARGLALTGKEAKGLTVGDALDRATREHYAKTKAHKSAEVNMRKLKSFFGADTPLREIDEAAILSFIEKRRKEGASDATINRQLAQLSKTMKFCFSTWVVKGKPAIERMPYIPHLKETGMRHREVTPEEEAAVVRTLRLSTRETHKLTAKLIPFLMDTGMRLSEALRVTPFNVDEKRGVIRVLETKNGRPRVVPMTSRVRAIVADIKADTGKPLFDGLTVFTADKAWAWARKELDMEGDKTFVLHALRHTCASRLLQGGADIKSVQEWLGHSTVTTTERYAWLKPENLTNLTSILERGE